ELSWIDFNGRVLGEATDTANPLLERGDGDHYQQSRQVFLCGVR
ncbi:hypothetical protein DN440_09315, partial [Lactobacillus reuteri]|nr:hypothetical protein [Limosilactobacillus reuteri]